MGQVDAPTIQELAAARQRHQFRGIAVLGHAHPGDLRHCSTGWKLKITKPD
jgi:hypothetical protein